MLPELTVLHRSYLYNLLVQTDLVGWYIELSFVPRIVTYVSILGLVLIIIFLILKYLGAYNEENDIEDFSTTPREIFVPTRTEQSETGPLLAERPAKLTYGICEEDPEAESSNNSSYELYDGKICVICYDEARNCFFVPCGHCATAMNVLKARIMEGESRASPICRRLFTKCGNCLLLRSSSYLVGVIL